MAKHKKAKDIGVIKPTGALVGGAVILGVGSSVVGAAGGPVGGLTAAASFMPVIGTGVGVGLTIQQLRKLEEQTKRKRRR